MDKREQLIEAFKSRADEWDSYDFDPNWDYAKEAGILADIALAVFEGAYANDLATSSERVKNRPDSSHVIPTDDEREALARALYAEYRERIPGTLTWENDSKANEFRTQAGRMLPYLHRTIQGDSKDLRVAESPVQGEPTRDSEEHLRGRWSNGDPVHIITDGSNRHVAPNLNGATWIPGAVEPYDRYAEHDRAKREGGYCRGCDEKFPAPQGQPSDVQELLTEADALVESWDRKGSWSSDSPVGLVMRLARALRAAAETV